MTDNRINWDFYRGARMATMLADHLIYVFCVGWSLSNALFIAGDEICTYTYCIYGIQEFLKHIGFAD